MGQHLLTIHGHKVYCDDDPSFHGVKHLAYELPADGTRGLFAQAEAGREVDFEDKNHRKFTLVDGENGSFTVVTHNKPSGWI